MEALGILSGISFASGLNIYATVLAIGLIGRFEIVHLPATLTAVSSTPVLIGAAAMFAIEFVADKIPYVDSVWDIIHTVIRPIGGAILGYSAVGDVRPELQIFAALAGGGLAFTAHAAKATARAAANVSPEPFSNWILSMSEDSLALFLVWISVSHPWMALVLVALLVATAAWIAVKLSQLGRRLWASFQRAIA